MPFRFSDQRSPAGASKKPAASYESDGTVSSYSRLLGLWRSADKGSRAYFHIGKSDDDTIQIVMIEHKKDDDLEKEEYSAHRSVVNNVNYLNGKYTEKTVAKRDSFLLNTGLEEWLTNIYITSGSAGLAECIRKNDPLLFTESLKLIRVE